MEFEVLESKTKKVLQKIGENGALADFYMAGGTALALQLNHRQSIDLDWFSQKSFSSRKLIELFSSLGKLVVNFESEDTLHLVLDGVKISLFYYPYDLLRPLISYAGGVFLASDIDIACMKLQAISSRGSKKDFIDLYFLLKKYSIGEALNSFDKKFAKVKYNRLHLLKSLVFFDDAENEPMPIMLLVASWGEVKEDVSQKVKDYEK